MRRLTFEKVLEGRRDQGVLILENFGFRKQHVKDCMIFFFFKENVLQHAFYSVSSYNISIESWFLSKHLFFFLYGFCVVLQPSTSIGRNAENRKPLDANWRAVMHSTGASGRQEESSKSKWGL